MGIKRYRAEEIILKLREADVELGRCKAVPEVYLGIFPAVAAGTHQMTVVTSKNIRLPATLAVMHAL